MSEEKHADVDPSFNKESQKDSKKYVTAISEIAREYQKLLSASLFLRSPALEQIQK